MKKSNKLFSPKPEHPISNPKIGSNALEDIYNAIRFNKGENKYKENPKIPLYQALARQVEKCKIYEKRPAEFEKCKQELRVLVDKLNTGEIKTILRLCSSHCNSITFSCEYEGEVYNFYLSPDLRAGFDIGIDNGVKGVQDVDYLYIVYDQLLNQIVNY